MKVSVVGLGYVGLPLAIRLSLLKYDVLGIDKNPEKVNSLKKGKLPFAKNEPKLSNYFEKSKKLKNLNFSHSFRPLKASEIIFICVDTPVKKQKPDYTSLLSAVDSISKYLNKNQIIIVESTVAPNTTKNILIPRLEKKSGVKINQDFFVAVVPERIRPNHIFQQLTTLSRVIGISSPIIRGRLTSLYNKITSGEIDFTDLTTAEVVKTVENTYRDVQIAFANEIALACENLEVDVNVVRNLVNKSPYRDMHQPGAGVGGHCIPKDPWLLMSSVKPYSLNITRGARKLNDSMPRHVFDLIIKALQEQKIDPVKSNIAILGYSYVENTDDFRDSPTIALLKLLNRYKINFQINDPEVRDYSKKPPSQIINNSDCLVLMVAHDQYRNLNLDKLAKIMRHKIIIDGRNFFNRVYAQKAGFLYKGIGNV